MNYPPATITPEDERAIEALATIIAGAAVRKLAAKRINNEQDQNEPDDKQPRT